MTRKEEIQWEAGGIVNRMVQRGVSQDYDTYYQAFQDGARWADKTMIEKVCDWIEKHIFDFPWYDNEQDDFSSKDVANALRKAMEE